MLCQRWKVHNSAVKVIEVSASFGTARNKKASFKRSSAQMISDMGTMCKKI